MTATLEHGELTTDAAVAAAAAMGWQRVCAVADLEPAWGEAALINGRQVALFRTISSNSEEIYAVDQRCPATGAHVMARGILGSRGQRATIASPLHKEVYDLRTGECFSAQDLRLETFSVRVVDGFVEVAL